MRPRQTVLVLLGLWSLALAAPSCVSGTPTNTEPTDEIKANIVDQAPEGLTTLNVNFDDKITLLGVKVEPGLDIDPGQRVKLTMYWRADRALGEPDWKLFTHVLDGSGDRLMNIDNVGTLRHLGRNGQAWPPSSWVPGKVYVDEQSFTMPRKVKTSQVQVVAGIWKGRQRLAVRSGPSSSENRAVVATFTTRPSANDKNVKVPQLEVARLKKGSSIRIDGKLDEAAWSEAAATSAFVNVRTGDPDPKAPVQGSAKVIWDDKSLYLAFDVKDEDVVGGFDKRQQDPQLWTKDCVEIMIDPDGNGDNKDYYEIQINPQNLVFDSRFDEYNLPKEEPNGPFGHQDWSAKLESAVHVRGTLDDSKDKDDGYLVEARIPWASFDKATEVPPKPGASWRLNLYAMQNNDGLAWSPILEQGNFHKASRFGRVRWVTEFSERASAQAGKGAAGAGNTPAPAATQVVSSKDPPQAPAAPAVAAPLPAAPASTAPSPAKQPTSE
jgi:hypothetical protein